MSLPEISLSPSVTFGSNHLLLDNLHHLYHETQERNGQFQLIYKNKILPMIILRANKTDFVKQPFYIIRSIGMGGYLYNIKISFYQSNIFQNYCHVGDISKNKDFSGTEILTLLITLLRLLHCEVCELNDGSYIMCEDQHISLKFYLTLKQNRTFYMRFGFERFPSNFRIQNVKGIESYNRHYDQILELFKRLTTVEFMTKLEHFKSNVNDDYTLNQLQKLQKSIQEYDDNELTQPRYLYQYILKSYDEHCQDVILYEEFSDYVFGNQSLQHFLQYDPTMILFLSEESRSRLQTQFNHPMSPQEINTLTLLHMTYNPDHENKNTFIEGYEDGANTNPDEEFRITRKAKKSFEVADTYYLQTTFRTIELYIKDNTLFGKMYYIDLQKNLTEIEKLFTICKQIQISEVDCGKLPFDVLAIMALDISNFQHPIFQHFYVTGENIIKEMTLLHFIEHVVVDYIYNLDCRLLLQQYQEIDLSTGTRFQKQTEMSIRNIINVLQNHTFANYGECLRYVFQSENELKDFLFNGNMEDAEYQFTMPNHNITFHLQSLTLLWRM